uniref:Cryptochrome/DNA photolyase FAD-binding domain-containing protein n=1 Tax=Biomphalaria glabrata TaxID=6526 RepID=A0A182YTQ9_BIOGL
MQQSGQCAGHSILSKLDPPLQPCEALTSAMVAEVTTPVSDDHDDRFSVPSLDELGFDVDSLGPAQFRGGESEALARLYRHLERKIPWDHNPEALSKWAEGMTGYPWIDAIMVQLRKEGWIHHLARHAVACFLTRGDLWISWEEGMKVFDEMLLDADWSVNAGMWMWLSCSAFFQQFFHCYCPVGFGKRADPSGDFVRHYLPILKGFPTQYIYEPWTAPESVQKAAKCIIGKDYPLPMVQHTEACRVNLERMRQVYKRLVLKSTASKRMFLDLPKIPK